MRSFLAFLFLAAAASAQNIVVNLLAPVEAASPGGEVRVDLVVLNPTSTEIVFEGFEPISRLAFSSRVTPWLTDWARFTARLSAAYSEDELHRCPG